MTRTRRFFESVWYGRPRRRWAEASLYPAEALFCAAVRARAALYAVGLKRRVVLPVPVVVIGNVSVGGTGKTPLLIWLAARLRERGYTPGVVSRGYGGRSATWPRRVAAAPARRDGADPYATDDPHATVDPREVGDEPVLIAERTGAPVGVGPDRVGAAELLLSGAAPRIDVLLSDDGLQHHRLARVVEIAVVDGARGLGNGRCLPAGPLREPPARLARVDAVVVNGGREGDVRRLRERSGAGERFVAPERFFRAALEPGLVRRVHAPHERRTLADFEGRRVHAVAGIGHPERFFEMLERHGLEVVRHPLADHAEILPGDLAFDDAPVLVTEKDAVKCRAFAAHDVWSVAVDFRFDAGGADALVALVLERLPAPLGGTK